MNEHHPKFRHLQHTRRTFRRLAAAIALISGMLAAGPAGAQKSGGILQMLDFASPASMSIHEEATIAAVMPMMGVFNNLVIYDQHVPQNSLDSIVPDLATSWAWSEDGKELTFKLRHGVKWHDGKPFTAADVKCTWDLLTGNGARTNCASTRARPGIAISRTVTTNGDDEATFHLKRPQPAFIALLASGYSPVYPCHVSPAQMRQHPIGTGPFKFVEYKPNQSIKVAGTRITGSRGGPISTASNTRSSRTARPRCSPSSPASST